jgi:hypothetical protein
MSRTVSFDAWRTPPGRFQHPARPTTQIEDVKMTANNEESPSDAIKVRDGQTNVDVTLSELRTLIAANLRETAIAYVVKELQRLERRFKDDDPVLDALVTARRAVAEHLVVAPTGAGG